MNKPSYLALGDSYTIGEGVSEKDSWPEQLSRVKGWQRPRIIAKTGWTTRDLLSHIPEGIEKHEFGSLLIGVNNQYQGLDRNLFLNEFKNLTDILLACSVTPFIVTIPNYGCTPFGSSKKAKIELDLKWYNETIKEIGLAKQITVTDIYDLTCTEYSSEHLVLDKLHPSAKSYKEWTSLISDKI